MDEVAQNPHAGRFKRFYERHVETPVAPLITAAGIGTNRKSAAKTVLQQAKRLVELADEMLKLKPGRDAFAVFWYVTCAESISKLEQSHASEDGSKKHVLRFFNTLVPAASRDELAESFTNGDGEPLSLHAGVTALYRVRCALAHDGEYWEFRFSKRGHPTSIATDGSVRTSVSRDRFSAMIVEGAVEAARLLLARGSVQ